MNSNKEEFLRECFNDAKKSDKYKDIPDIMIMLNVLIANLVSETEYNGSDSKNVRDAIGYLAALFQGVLEEAVYARETIEKMHEIIEKDN